MKTHTFKIFALKGLQRPSLAKEENALIMSADGNGRGTQASSSVRQKLKKCILSCNEKRAFAKEIRRAMKTYRASGHTTLVDLGKRCHRLTGETSTADQREWKRTLPKSLRALPNAAAVQLIYVMIQTKIS